MSYSRRLKLLCLTATSGVRANLDILSGSIVSGAVLEAAAAAGHLHICKWLRQQGFPWQNVLLIAAEAGHRNICAWLLASGCPWRPGAVYAAARGGHTDLLQWLLQQQPDSESQIDPGSMVAAAARGCDLASLQRLCGSWLGWLGRDNNQLGLRNGDEDAAEQTLSAQQQDQQRHQEVTHAQQQQHGRHGQHQQDQQQHPQYGQQPEGASAQDEGAMSDDSDDDPGVERNAEQEEEEDDDEGGELHTLPLDRWQRTAVLKAAAASPTPDWRAKVAWLEAQGCPRSWDACRLAAAAPADAAQRLDWLQQRGYPMDKVLVDEAARAGNLPALQFLLETARLPLLYGGAMEEAAREGHLEAMKYMYERGCSVTVELVCLHAAAKGHLDQAEWLLGLLDDGEEDDCETASEEPPQAGETSVDVASETTAAATAATAPAATAATAPAATAATASVQKYGPRVAEIVALMLPACLESGNLEMMLWLNELHIGGGDGGGVFYNRNSMFYAASGGCEAMMEWLVERGCPMLDTGGPYERPASRGDLAALRCLRRLGCPWGPGCSLFSNCVALSAPLPVLRWLLDEGCPVDWEHALSAVEGRNPEAEQAEVASWLQREKVRRQLHMGQPPRGLCGQLKGLGLTLH